MKTAGDIRIIVVKREKAREDMDGRNVTMMNTAVVMNADEGAVGIALVSGARTVRIGMNPGESHDQGYRAAYGNMNLPLYTR